MEATEPGAAIWLLYAAGRGAVRSLSHHLASLEMTPSQWAVLAALSSQDRRSLRSLADETHIETPTMTSVVDGLERAGLVQRLRATTDRRVVTVVLTDTGRTRAAELARAAGEAENVIVRNLTDTQRTDLLNVLQAIVAALPA